MTAISSLMRAALCSALLLSLTPVFAAEATHDHHAMTASVAAYPLQATVISWQGDRVVLAHQPVSALGWPAMTMPFSLANAQLREGLKPGMVITARFELVPQDSPRLVAWQSQH